MAGIKLSDLEPGQLVYVEQGNDILLCEFQEARHRSRTMAAVECRERGIGWDSDKEAYKGITLYSFNELGAVCGSSWMRGESGLYGLKMNVHIDNITLYEEL